MTKSMEKANEGRFNVAVEEATTVAQDTGSVAYIVTVIANPYKGLRTYSVLNKEQRLAMTGHFGYGCLSHYVTTEGKVERA